MRCAQVRLWAFSYWLEVSNWHSLQIILPCLSGHREYAEDSQQSRQFTISNTHDHPWPGERNQIVASCEEPRPRGPEGGRPREQDGLRDIPDQAARYESKTQKSEHNTRVLKVVFQSG